jgi:hypothetical protein
VSSSSSGQTEDRETGHGQELLPIGGAGGTGDEEAGEGLKPDEEDEGSHKRRSPAAEIDENGLENEVNGAAVLASLRFGSATVGRWRRTRLQGAGGGASVQGGG